MLLCKAKLQYTYPHHTYIHETKQSYSSRLYPNELIGDAHYFEFSFQVINDKIKPEPLVCSLHISAEIYMQHLLGSLVILSYTYNDG